MESKAASQFRTSAAPDPSILASVSRETRSKLQLYADELMRWQGIKNLVGRTTLDDIWTRHFADSLQLRDLVDGRRWADLGTGAGFPGLVLAIAHPTITVDLIESDARKCAFLRHVARATGARVEVWDGRIEDVLPRLGLGTEVVTARALAPLTTLLGLGGLLLKRGAVGLFPKGRDHARELTRAAASWRFEAETIPSRIHPDARIIRVTGFRGALHTDEAA